MAMTNLNPSPHLLERNGERALVHRGSGMEDVPMRPHAASVYRSKRNCRSHATNSSGAALLPLGSMGGGAASCRTSERRGGRKTAPPARPQGKCAGLVPECTPRGPSKYYRVR